MKTHFMKKLLLILLLGRGSFGAAYATNYYVAPTGTNATANSTGLSADWPLQTIQYAADRTNLGGYSISRDVQQAAFILAFHPPRQYQYRFITGQCFDIMYSINKFIYILVTNNVFYS
ncbi:hypothetical protein [Hymenobacter terrenus]|uniref:hypothetical protein n=1 Tax=Hymenobacter terrenus TaxID=1629124 RepID=UPI000619B781|nr:hypothetical protein [Hymenobacter terrenus]